MFSEYSFDSVLVTFLPVIDLLYLIQRYCGLNCCPAGLNIYISYSLSFVVNTVGDPHVFEKCNGGFRMRNGRSSPLTVSVTCFHQCCTIILQRQLPWGFGQTGSGRYMARYEKGKKIVLESQFSIQCLVGIFATRNVLILHCRAH